MIVATLIRFPNPGWKIPKSGWNVLLFFVSLVLLTYHAFVLYYYTKSYYPNCYWLLIPLFKTKKTLNSWLRFYNDPANYRINIGCRRWYFATERCRWIDDTLNCGLSSIRTIEGQVRSFRAVWKLWYQIFPEISFSQTYFKKSYIIFFFAFY